MRPHDRRFSSVHEIIPSFSHLLFSFIYSFVSWSANAPASSLHRFPPCLLPSLASFKLFLLRRCFVVISALENSLHEQTSDSSSSYVSPRRLVSVISVRRRREVIKNSKLSLFSSIFHTVIIFYTSARWSMIVSITFTRKIKKYCRARRNIFMAVSCVIIPGSYSCCVIVIGIF